MQVLSLETVDCLSGGLDSMRITAHCVCIKCVGFNPLLLPPIKVAPIACARGRLYDYSSERSQFARTHPMGWDVLLSPCSPCAAGGFLAIYIDMYI